jgi:hypothetical protein
MQGKVSLAEKTEPSRQSQEERASRQRQEDAAKKTESEKRAEKTRVEKTERNRNPVFSCTSISPDFAAGNPGRILVTMGRQCGDSPFKPSINPQPPTDKKAKQTKVKQTQQQQQKSNRQSRKGKVNWNQAKQTQAKKRRRRKIDYGKNID